MKTKTVIRMLKNGDIFQMGPFMNDMEAVVRMHFYYAAIESGLLDAACEPKTRDELLEQLDVIQPEILDAVIDVGIALGEIKYKDGCYLMEGKRAGALRGRLGDGLKAMIQGNVTYYNTVYREATPRMRSLEKGNYLDEIGDIVARYSILIEPYLLDVIIDSVRKFSVSRMLDIGCGTGVYLCTAADENPDLKGIGIESDPKAAGIARQILAERELMNRIEIIEGDIFDLGPNLEGEFSLITFFNAVYYFTIEERFWIFKLVRELLSGDGGLVIVSSFRGQNTDLASANLNMATSSIAGCTTLPILNEVHEQLETCGFDIIKTERLIPGSSLFGIVSVKS